MQGRAADLRYVEGAAREIAKIATSSKIIVEKSTVPVKAAESISKVLWANHKSGVHFEVKKNNKKNNNKTRWLMATHYVLQVEINVTNGKTTRRCDNAMPV